MEFVKIYLNNEEKIIDVNDVPHYINMGWSLEKPKKEKEIEKKVSNKETKKEESK